MTHAEIAAIAEIHAHGAAAASAHECAKPNPQSDGVRPTSGLASSGPAGPVARSHDVERAMQILEDEMTKAPGDPLRCIGCISLEVELAIEKIRSEYWERECAALCARMRAIYGET